jgi:MFS family permease
MTAPATERAGGTAPPAFHTGEDIAAPAWSAPSRALSTSASSAMVPPDPPGQLTASQLTGPRPGMPVGRATSAEFTAVSLPPGARLRLIRRLTEVPAWDPGDAFSPDDYPDTWLDAGALPLTTEQSPSTPGASWSEEPSSLAVCFDACVVPGTCIFATRSPLNTWDPGGGTASAESETLWLLLGRFHLFIIQQLTDTSGELKLYGSYPPALPSSGTAVLERTTDDAQQTPAERKKRRSSWQLLAYHDFRLYFFGSLISNLGTWLQSTALVLIAYQVTNSVFMVGVITSAQFAGMILISPWAAVLVDRLSPRAVLVGSQCASAAIAAWMAWRYMVGMLGVHSLVFGALALGTCFAVALPIQTAMVPSLVGEADAKDAVKMNSVSYNAGRALAPALSVLVIATAGPRLIFALNALSFLIFAAILRRLKYIANDITLRTVIATRVRGLGGATTRALARANGEVTRGHLGVLHRTGDKQLREQAEDAALPGEQSTADDETSLAQSRQRPRARVTDGLRIARRDRQILLLLIIVATVTLADDPILVLSPALAHGKLGTSDAWAGYFIAALGWGSVLGSLPPSSTEVSTRRASRRAALSLLALGIAVVVFAKGFSPQISLAAAFAAGGLGLFTGATAQTALLCHQRKTRADVASVASVAALWAIAWAGTKPLASFIDGWLGSHISIVATSMILSAPAVVIALFALQRLKEDRPGVNGRLSEWLRLLVIPGAGFLPSVSPEPGSPSSDRLEPTFSLGRRHYRRKHLSQKATREPAHGQRAAGSGQAPAAVGISGHYRDARDSRNQPGPLRQGEGQDSTSSNVVTQDAIAQAS